MPTTTSRCLIGIVLGLMVITARADDQASALEFAQAEVKDVVREKQVEGLLEAVRQATLTAQTSGEVLEVLFDVDDRVEKGDLLVTISNTEQRATTAQSQAQMAEARAFLKAAQSEYNRVKKVFEKQAISASAMDKARAELDAAKARLAAVRAATTRTAEQEAYTSVVAPYSGVVTERHIEPGEIANIGSPIMSGMSLDELRVISYVSQSQIEAVRRHQKARVIVQMADDVNIIESDDLTISPQASPPSHTFKVRVNLPAGVEGLFPGVHAKVGFVVGEEKALMVPESAVAYRGEVRGLYVKGEDGNLAMRMVRLGARHGDEIEVLSGLSEDEWVALDPVGAAVTRKNQSSAQESGEH